MTHEELLERINELDVVCSAVGETAGALRAVVNLHSPDGKPESQCRNCKRFYPCHTIQAIIKELQ